MRILLAGTPNVGKSTLFNTLTGAKQKIVNAPGTTVALAKGKFDGHDLIDLPGFYSFATISPDEEVAAKALVNPSATPDAVIMVMDGAHLTKSLYLYSQLRHLALPVFVVCTMMDIAKKRGINFSEQQLCDIIGAKGVVFADGRHEEAKGAVLRLISGISNETQLDGKSLVAPFDPHRNAIENADENFEWVNKVEHELQLHADHKDTKSDKVDSVLLNPFLGILIFLALMFLCFFTVTTFSQPFIDLINGPFYDLFANIVPDDNVFGSLFMHGIFDGVITVLGFLPPLFFMFIYIALMETSGVLARTAVVADRLMRVIGLDGRSLIPLIIGFGCNLPAITATRIIPDSRLRRLTAMLIPFTLCSARLAVFTVFTIALFPENAVFVLFGLYLASIVAIIVVGLILRPFMVRNDCESPFIIALPTYQAPILKQLFKNVGVKLLQFINEAGKIIVAITLIVWFLQAIPLPGAMNEVEQEVTPLPKITVSDESLDTTSENYELDDNNETITTTYSQPATFADVKDVHQSLFGAISDGITPIFEPLGFANWHFSAALFSGFVAKEAFIGTLEQTYNIESDDYDTDDSVVDSETLNELDDSIGNNFSNAISATITQTSMGHNLPASLSLMLFILLYTPCMATVVLAAKEFNLKFALKSTAISLIFAYLVSFLVFQIGCLI